MTRAPVTLTLARRRRRFPPGNPRSRNHAEHYWRQVRIAAGALVLLGSILAWQVSLGFIALPAFVGAGLMFAGITDTCGMGMMLAKMPWNQRKGGAAAQASCSITR